MPNLGLACEDGLRDTNAAAGSKLLVISGSGVRLPLGAEAEHQCLHEVHDVDFALTLDDAELEQSRAHFGARSGSSS